LIHRHSRLSHPHAYTFDYTRMWIMAAAASTDRKRSTRENPGEWLSWIASRCEGDEEERNCDKGCWQAVTGTTLSATRFCAYHSPWVYHRRRQCRPRPIWSDLILVTLIHHPLSIRHLPSYTILLDLVVLCISRAKFSLSSLLLLLFSSDIHNRAWLFFDNIPKTPFPSRSLNDGLVNLKISIYSMSTQIVKIYSILSSFCLYLYKY